MINFSIGPSINNKLQPISAYQDLKRYRLYKTYEDGQFVSCIVFTVIREDCAVGFTCGEDVKHWWAFHDDGIEDYADYGLIDTGIDVDFNLTANI